MTTSLDGGTEMSKSVFKIQLHSLLSCNLLGISPEHEEDDHEDQGHQDQPREDAQDADEDSVGTGLGNVGDKNTRSARFQVWRPTNDTILHDDLNKGGVVPVVIKEAVHVIATSLRLWISESSFPTIG